MFNNRKWWLPAALVFLTLIAGCGGAKPAEVRLNDSFELGIGQSASVAGEGLKVTFESVAEDSRCPRGATCVWEGQANCIVKASHRDGEEKLLMTEPGLTEGREEISFRQYKIGFHLTPYPEVGKQIGKEEYRLQLKITK
jgi:hypothetical protein